MYYFEKKSNKKWQKLYITEVFKTKNKSDEDYFKLILNGIDLLKIKDKYLPDTLFKFYAPTSENILDIKNRRLWMSHPRSFNDPFDCQTGYDSLAYEKHFLLNFINNVGCVEEINSKVGFTIEERNRIIRSSTSLKYWIYNSKLEDYQDVLRTVLQPKSEDFQRKVSIMLREAIKKLEYKINKLRNVNIRVACFSELDRYDEFYKKIQMWSHYAENHKGFCVEYDVSPLKAENIKAKIEEQIGDMLYKLGDDISDLTVSKIEEKLKDLENEQRENRKKLTNYKTVLEQFGLVADDLEKNLNNKLIEINSNLTTMDRNIIEFTEIGGELKKVILYLRNSLDMKKMDQTNQILKKLQKRLEYLSKLKEQFVRLGSEVPGVINEMAITILNNYKDTVNEFYRVLNPQPLFTKLDWIVSQGVSDGSLILKSSSEDEEHHVNPSYTFSAAQVNIVALSFFLSFALQQQWSNLGCIFMDDPIQNMDDINIFSFVDVIRGICLNSATKKQVLFLQLSILISQ